MMSKKTYILVNPYIEGSLNKLVKAKNSFSAAKHLYQKMSNLFSNHVENFNFAIQNIETKDITHYNIHEKAKRHGTGVNYDLRQIPIEVIPEGINKTLIKKFDDMESEQNGGKHIDDNSSISSSESEYYHNDIYIQQIVKFTYFCIPYIEVTPIKLVGLNINDFKSLFMPTFNLPVIPIIEIRIDFIY